MTAVRGLEDVRRAWRTVEAANTEWVPAGPVVMVLSAHGGAGGSTVALAIATAAGDARIVECCTASASGLAAASTAELGQAGADWRRGSRGPVLIDRLAGRATSLAEIPTPPECDRRLTVVDCAGDPDVAVNSAGWLSRLARGLDQIVVVARPTVPGLRRLETASMVLGGHRVRAVLVGCARRDLRAVEQAAGPWTRSALAADAVALVPHDPRLAMAGLSPDDLPASVLDACSNPSWKEHQDA